MQAMKKIRLGSISGAKVGKARRRAELLLLAPDDNTTRQNAEALVAEHAIRIVADIETLRSALAMRGADLVILDQAAIGEQDLYDLCRHLRASSAVALIVLLQPEDSEERVRFLEAGADDCFLRNGDLRELRARVLGLLRRTAFGVASIATGQRFRFAGFTIDPHRRLLTDPQGILIDLTAAQFDLLWAFCRNSGRPLSRRTLLTLTHVGVAGPIRRSIDVHVSRLRAKIESDPHRPALLKTVRLGGYVFTPEVEADPSDDPGRD
jgi:DNA-binding response OmpR family regulator